MRRYLYSNLLRIIFTTLLSLLFIPSTIFFVCSLLIDNCINITSLILALSCPLLMVLLELLIFILNNKSNNSVIFEKEIIVYKGKTIYSNDASIKYFKFYISIIEPDLVIPKIYITGNNYQILCYLSKKDIKKLRKMNYQIKDI